MGCLFLFFNLFLILIFGSFVGLVISAFDRGGSLTQPLAWIVPAGIVFIVFMMGLAFLAARNIRRMSTPLDELVEAIREHGVADVREVNLAMFEVDGNISILSGNYSRRIVKTGMKKNKKVIRNFLFYSCFKNNNQFFVVFSQD